MSRRITDTHQPRCAPADAELGMKWWNGLTKAERMFWLHSASVQGTLCPLGLQRSGRVGSLQKFRDSHRQLPRLARRASHRAAWAQRTMLSPG